MTQDVRQWLGEIKHLQQKLAEAHKERDEAFASAANWRHLYETEAKQRRTEAALMQQSIDALKAELETRHNPSENYSPSTADQALLAERLQALQTVEALQAKLLEAWQECDRLSQSLLLEQQRHAETRRELTTALGDTMERLTKAQNGSSAEASSVSAQALPLRSPSLELPQLDQVQSRT